MKVEDYPYIKPEMSDNGKPCTCFKCGVATPEYEGWISRTGFICDNCQKLNEMGAMMRVEKRKPARITKSSHPGKWAVGSTYFLDYKPGATAACVYTGERQDFYAEREHNESTTWFVGSDEQNAFELELEEM